MCIFEACGGLWLSVSCPGGHIGFRSVMCFLALLPCLLVPFGGWVLARAGGVPSFGSACEYLFLSSSLVHGPSLHQVEGVILPCAESALFQRSQPVLRKSPVLNLCTLLPSLGCFHTSYQPLKNMYLFFSPSLRTFFLNAIKMPHSTKLLGQWLHSWNRTVAWTCVLDPLRLFRDTSLLFTGTTQIVINHISRWNASSW